MIMWSSVLGIGKYPTLDSFRQVIDIVFYFCFYLMVEDVNKTIDWYKKNLDFELLMTVPEEGKYDWAMMKSGDVVLMFQSQKSLTEELPLFNGASIGGSLTFYVDMEDAKKLFDKLKNKVTIVQDFRVAFYGRAEFSIKDCNGYILTFSEEHKDE
jgi:uncharacterized glyoxalase superfamily protein PhnB